MKQSGDGSVFVKRLTALHEVCNALSHIDSFDDLCRWAVELGRTRLGFPRLSIWFLDGHGALRGSFGTSVKGETVDERNICAPISPFREALIQDEKRLHYGTTARLIDSHGHVVGAGCHATAHMWDGTQVIGAMNADDLTDPGALTQEQAELLVLYASSFGHLCSHKRAQEALRESEKRYRQVLEKTTDLVTRVDAEGRFIYVNPAAKMFLGLDAQSCVGLPAFDFVHPDDRQQTYEWFMLNAAHGIEHASVESRQVNCRTGAVFHMMWAGQYEYDARGNVIAVNGIARDISKLKQAEETVVHLSRQLAALHEVSNELARAETFDDLCRRGIELGRQRLGFSRLGLWFFDSPSSRWFRGSFGTSATGETLDERGIHREIGESTRVQVRERRQVRYTPAGEVWDAHHNEVGAGSRAAALLWDGTDIIGIIFADDLLSPGSLTEAQAELLGQYAVTIGHLCSRKRAEEAAVQFSQRLAALHEVSNELARAETFDDLCRMAVELGRSRLGFSRLGIWFFDGPDSSWVTGAYGTSDAGETVDERHIRRQINHEYEHRIRGGQRLHFTPERPLWDGQQQRLGTGAHAMAPLWNGLEIMGTISADDLLVRGSLDETGAELLALFATTIGHLCLRKRVEEELRVLNDELERRVVERTSLAESRAAQLQKLANDLVQTEQRERERMAHVLHDDLQQVLVAAKFQISALRKRSMNHDIGKRLDVIDEHLNESLDVSRTMTAELYPTVLYEAGLGPALDHLARQMKAKHGLNVDTDIDDGLEYGDRDVAYFLFQSVRELLFNIIKHAGTMSAFVGLERLDDRDVEVVVSDCGIGFDPSGMTSSSDIQTGLGLLWLQERTEYIGGRLTIDSAPGQGTRVSLVVPLPK